MWADPSGCTAPSARAKIDRPTKSVSFNRFTKTWGFSTKPLIPLWILVRPTVQTLPETLQVSQCLRVSRTLDLLHRQEYPPDKKIIVDLASVSPSLELFIQLLHSLKATIAMLPELRRKAEVSALALVL